MKQEKNTFNKGYMQSSKKNGILFTSTSKICEIIKGFFENILQEVLDVHLGYAKYQTSKSTNSSNGYSPKTAKGMFGQRNLNVPRDRDASFKPKILPKHKKDVSELTSKVISLYAMGTSTRDAIAAIKVLDRFDMDPNYISKITVRLLPKIEKFKTRRLDKIHPMILLDEIRFKTQEKRSLKRGFYLHCTWL